MKPTSMSALLRALVVFSLIASILLPFSAGSASADLPFTEEQRQELAERYAPVLQYVNGENCYPVDVDYYLESCSLYQVVDQTAVLITDSPTIPQLAALTTDDYFLDDRLGGVDDDLIIQAYQANLSQLGYTVYYHIDSGGGMIYIQYWMFYVFNPGSVNAHEGDWEMVEVLLDMDMNPIATTYSQHHSGVTAQWSDVIVQDDTHVTAYVALGSHANYYRYYQGKIQGMDQCGEDGLNLQPDDYGLVEISEAIPGEDPDTSWVWYGGRWGTIPDVLADARGDAGPPGPMYREEGAMWDGVVFYADARDLSTSTLWLEFILYYLTWILIALLALAIVLTGWRAYKMRKKGELKFPYFEILNVRAKGKRGMANIIALLGLVIAVVGLLYPIFTMEIYVPQGDYATDGFVTLFSLGGTDLFVLNTLDPSGEVVNVGAFAVNFALILGIMIFSFVLNSLAATPRRAAKKYIGFGITLLIIFIVFFLVVIFIGPLAEMIAPSDNGGMVDILQYMSHNPFGGEATLDNPTYGEIQLRWGFELGSLLLLGGIALIIAGVLMRSAAKAEAK